MKLTSNNKTKWAIFSIVILFMLVWFGKWALYRLSHATTNDAFVDSDMVNISPLVAGHIKEILVKEGQKVKKGQLLALIDDRDYMAMVKVNAANLKHAQEALERAKITSVRVTGEVTQGIKIAKQNVILAQKAVSQAENALEFTKVSVEEGIKAATDALKAARANLTLVKKDYDRFKRLYERGSLEKQKFDEITAKLSDARAGVTAAKSKLAEAKAARHKIKIAEDKLKQALANYKKSQAALKLAIIKKKHIQEAHQAVKELQAQVNQAKHALETAKLKLEHTRIKSPFDGVIAKKFVHQGDFVSPGYPVFSIYDTKNIYIWAYLEETKFKKVRIGQEVDIEADAFPDMQLIGKVVEIEPAAGAKFAILPRDNSAGEFTKVVQRIPIKIIIPGYHGNKLLPGMSVYIGIKTGF